MSPVHFHLPAMEHPLSIYVVLVHVVVLVVVSVSLVLSVVMVLTSMLVVVTPIIPPIQLQVPHVWNVQQDPNVVVHLVNLCFAQPVGTRQRIPVPAQAVAVHTGTSAPLDQIQLLSSMAPHADGARSIGIVGVGPAHQLLATLPMTALCHWQFDAQKASTVLVVSGHPFPLHVKRAFTLPNGPQPSGVCLARATTFGIRARYL